MLQTTTPFGSLLYEAPVPPLEPGVEAPECFSDLFLDQIVDAVVEGRDSYQIKNFFYRPLTSVEAIGYRQEIVQDLDNPVVEKPIRAFAQTLQTMREYLALAEKLYYPYQKARWFLDAVGVYCQAADELNQGLASLTLNSKGLTAFREFLQAYIHSDPFMALKKETLELKAALDAVVYCVRIQGSTVTVLKYQDEADYGQEVLNTFAKFKQGAVKEYRVKFSDWPEMDHVEAQVLDLVALLYPETFGWLERFYHERKDYLDPTLGEFDRQAQFYLAYLEYIAPLRNAGLSFCYPKVSDQSKEVRVEQGFDLGLARKLVHAEQSVVSNDFYLQDPERILVITGPNQGGKTTFSRMFGQLHYLAALGLPVPGQQAQLFLFDHLLTHFERAEDPHSLRGKLEDDLLRIHQILERATPHSIVILNEIFNSTTFSDALFLSQEILKALIQKDLLCVWVTFIDELTTMEKTVSMVSTVVADEPDRRTYKVIRKPADGLAYALSLARKYGLTYDRLKERVKP
ncbi:MutS-related protein [Meiothermus granaticius]|uniref:DNA mismatch repair protein MutS n=1 Tax=Meiothermus granaticius NBRC 107808 TaxID=1227551 RepID=A0A399FCW3_9DEIN|nr:DNA mismatch repair protein MutS [Meiothermus granaticius]MCL6527901.1 DNA mismatch repair protein MutS [Thermaceae bacterium]RIH93616.1 DNA mismatch repair protein MutS [Meiothermus granaticius NBRC 107808]GEM87253.1 DNA mismatch repair protein MutS [Meiothermus granaticius NBRC 107808]